MPKASIQHTVHCPRCKTAAEVTRVDALEIDRCASCGGLWFDVGELKELRELSDDVGVRHEITLLLESATLGANVERGDQPLLCPICGLRMTRRPHEGAPEVVIDRCNLHGTWLDRGEAQRLLQLVSDADERQRKAGAERRKKGWLSAILDLID